MPADVQPLAIAIDKGFRSAPGLLSLALGAVKFEDIGRIDLRDAAVGLDLGAREFDLAQTAAAFRESLRALEYGVAVRPVARTRVDGDQFRRQRLFQITALIREVGFPDVLAGCE